LHCSKTDLYTANEGPVRIPYKCLVPIYVFPEIKLRSLLFPKQNYNVLYLNFQIHVSVSNIYTGYSQDQSASFSAANKQTDPENIKIAHRHMNIGIGNEAA
jgi:hypothetical protein